MADWQAETRKAAERYGLDPDTFVRQIQQESGFNPRAVSPAGAQGIAQIMPATARGWGVNPLDPHAALDAAAKNMAGYVKQFGSYRNALIAYNAGPGAVGRATLPAETQHYIATILGHGAAPVGSPALMAPSAGNTTAAGAVGSSAPAPPSQGTAGDFTSLLGSLLAPHQQQAPSSTPLAPPAFAAHPVLPQGAQALAPMQDQAPAQDPVSASLGLLGGLRGSGPTDTAPQPSGVAQTVFAQREHGTVAGSVQAGRTGKVTVAPGANREGVGLTSTILRFARRIAGIYGHPLTIGTGTNHSQYTVNGNVSNHWDGNGVDIPLTGDALITAGQAALIAAGMPRKQALKQTGGLYNVGPYQVIFNTHEGGDHTNHLHAGYRGHS